MWTRACSACGGQRPSASRTLAGKGDPAGCPRQASPARAIALLGGALAGSGPGTSLYIGGLSVASGTVVPPGCTCSNHTEDDGWLGRHGRQISSLSGRFAGCVLAAGARDGQLIRVVELTVVDRWIPRMSVLCGTRVARETRANPDERRSQSVRGPVKSPPSTGSVCPVIQAASLEAKNATAAATSSGSPTRPSG